MILVTFSLPLQQWSLPLIKNQINVRTKRKMKKRMEHFFSILRIVQHIEMGNGQQWENWNKFAIWSMKWDIKGFFFQAMLSSIFYYFISRCIVLDSFDFPTLWFAVRFCTCLKCAFQFVSIWPNDYLFVLEKPCTSSWLIVFLVRLRSIFDNLVECKSESECCIGLHGKKVCAIFVVKCPFDWFLLPAMLVSGVYVCLCVSWCVSVC